MLIAQQRQRALVEREESFQRGIQDFILLPDEKGQRAAKKKPNRVENRAPLRGPFGVGVQSNKQRLKLRHDLAGLLMIAAQMVNGQISHRSLRRPKGQHAVDSIFQPHQGLGAVFAKRIGFWQP